MGKMQRTNLVWDNYMDYLIDAINGSNFMKRIEEIHMSTPKTPRETYITTRSNHVREAADIAKRIAKELGLNADYIYISMLMHDAGHQFSAHEGEDISNQLGEVYNTQYFHHNAKGVETILSEDICGKAISKIPNIENNPELRKKLEEEFPYFLDVVISHDGEATREDMMKSETPYASIKEAVRAKMKSANSTNKYKFIAQTPEGKIAKFADVISYLSSDMQDGFRLGILKEFSDDYLELFGEMLSKEPPKTREEKIACGRKLIEGLKKQGLREEEKREIATKAKQDKVMDTSIKAIARKIKEANLNIFNQEDADKIQEIIEQEKQNFRQIKLEEFFSTKGANIPEEARQELEARIAQKSAKGIPLEKMEDEFAKALNRINAEASKVEEFATKMLSAKSNVIYELTSKMKEHFINDLIENSQNQDTPQFSNETWDAFFRAKQLNYKEFVQYTNWDYQTKELPQATMELVEECAEALVKSGAIRNKFYDEAVREHVQDADALKYMETQYRPESEYTSYRKENGIGDIKAFTTPSSKKFTGSKKQQEQMNLYHNVYSYVQEQEKVFAVRYEDTFNAIKTRVSKKIETALTENHQVSDKHLFKDIVQAQVDSIRQEIIDAYGAASLTPEQKDEFTSKKIEEERKAIEYKMATQLAINFLANETDRSLPDIAIQTGHLNPEIIAKAKRGGDASGLLVYMKALEKAEENFKNASLKQKPTDLSAPAGVDDGR